MALQPITSARRPPLHWLGFDQGVLLVTVALIGFWSGQHAVALIGAACGAVVMGHAGYRTYRQIHPSVAAELHEPESLSSIPG
jgi:hypothetical protein